MTEKALEAYNDVFADIVNVLLFNGKEKIKEEELTALKKPHQSFWKWPELPYSKLFHIALAFAITS